MRNGNSPKWSIYSLFKEISFNSTTFQQGDKNDFSNLAQLFKWWPLAKIVPRVIGLEYDSSCGFYTDNVMSQSITVNSLNYVWILSSNIENKAHFHLNYIFIETNQENFPTDEYCECPQLFLFIFNGVEHYSYLLKGLCSIVFARDFEIYIIKRKKQDMHAHMDRIKEFIVRKI